MDLIIFKIFSDVVVGYTLSTSIFLLICTFYDKFRYCKLQYLDTANRILLVLSFAFYIIYLTFFLKNISSNANDISPYSYRTTSIVWTTLTSMLIPSLFFSKKFRQNLFIILLVTASLLIYTNYERSIIIITNFYRNYVPSNWSVDYGSKNYLGFGLSGSMYFGLVLLTMRLTKKNA